MKKLILLKKLKYLTYEYLYTSSYFIPSSIQKATVTVIVLPAPFLFQKKCRYHNWVRHASTKKKAQRAKPKD